MLLRCSENQYSCESGKKTGKDANACLARRGEDGLVIPLLRDEGGLPPHPKRENTLGSGYHVDMKNELIFDKILAVCGFKDDRRALTAADTHGGKSKFGFFAVHEAGKLAGNPRT